jgi:hypothetical protein
MKRCHSSGTWSSEVIASTGAGLDAGIAVDALLWIDVELVDLLVVGLIGGGMDAVHWADLDARVVLDSDARFSDDVRHSTSFLCPKVLRVQLGK